MPVSSGDASALCIKCEICCNLLESFIFFSKVGIVSTGNIDPQKLPPTEGAAHYHSLRVHLQVISYACAWKKLTSDDLDPKQWGWKLDGKVLSPIMIDINATPENLKFVQCS